MLIEEKYREKETGHIFYELKMKFEKCLKIKSINPIRIVTKLQHILGIHY